MKQMPGTFRGAVEARMRKMAGWTGRRPHENPRPDIYRILRSVMPRKENFRLLK